ncbi:unnamed protein product [Rhizophagus irregularis]|nr:unnamed protein product [Rhizophagus irregularis]
MANFKNAFSVKQPDIHVVIGPPSTGKTALIRQVVQSSKCLFKPIFINLCNGQFDIPQRVYDSIYSQFNPFFNKYKSLLKNNFVKKLCLEYTDFNLLNRFNNRYREKTSDDVRILLEKITNLLNQLGHKDKSLLKLILNWFVLNSKERERFHIVLTSSDSFFFTWLTECLNTLHVKPYIIGDLTNQEAEEYFEKHAFHQYGCKELSGKFNQIRKITGTRIFIINKYINEYKIYRNDGIKFKANRFSVYESEYNKLNHGLYPDSYNFRFLDKLNPPLWNDVDLIKVMNEIVKAENQGYIFENDLIKEIGAEKVYSLIDYNFLHHRLTTRFTYDIIDPPNKIILTAMNQPSVCAMKQVLSEIVEKK